MMECLPGNTLRNIHLAGKFRSVMDRVLLSTNDLSKDINGYSTFIERIPNGGVSVLDLSGEGNPVHFVEGFYRHHFKYISSDILDYSDVEDTTIFKALLDLYNDRNGVALDLPDTVDIPEGTIRVDYKNLVLIIDPKDVHVRILRDISFNRKHSTQNVTASSVISVAISNSDSFKMYTKEYFQ